MNYDGINGQEVPSVPCGPYDEVCTASTLPELKSQIRRASNLNSLQCIAYFVLARFITGILAQFNFFDGMGNAAFTISIYTISHPITITALILLFSALTKKSLRGVFAKPQKSPLWILKWIVIGCGFSYLSNYVIAIIGIIIKAFTGGEMFQLSFDTEGSGTGIMLFIVISIYAPIFEELFFRGSMLSRTSKFGVIFSAIIIGVMFGLWHANIRQFVYASVMGTVAAYMTLKSRSIIPAMLLHFTLNFIGTMQTLIMPRANVEAVQEMLNNGETVQLSSSYIWYFALIAIGLLCMGFVIGAIIIVALEFSLHREKFRVPDACPQLTLKKKLITYATAPVTLIFLIGITVYSVLFTFGFI